jgi:O-acetyl-ADP-ribose deacetylase (regulator of RNase III)
MIFYVKESILNTKIKYLAHGVNCQNDMKSGIAKVIFNKYPEVKERYHYYYSNVVDIYPEGNMDKDLLGRVQFVNAGSKIILNCFTQRFYGNRNEESKNFKYLSYDAIFDCFSQIRKCGIKKVAIPKIGCGRAGGDWSIVKRIISEAVGEEVDVYVYSL